MKIKNVHINSVAQDTIFFYIFTLQLQSNNHVIIQLLQAVVSREGRGRKRVIEKEDDGVDIKKKVTEEIAVDRIEERKEAVIPKVRKILSILVLYLKID